MKKFADFLSCLFQVFFLMKKLNISDAIKIIRTFPSSILQFFFLRCNNFNDFGVSLQSMCLHS